MEILVAILGTAVTLISFIYAVYTNKKYLKLIDYNKEMSWEIYRQIATALEIIQTIRKLPKDKNDDIVILYEREESVMQELILDSMKMIKRFEKIFSEEKLNFWFKKGIIPNESHLKVFKKYLDDR